jgi:hypothetical protein
MNNIKTYTVFRDAFHPALNHQRSAGEVLPSTPYYIIVWQGRGFQSIHNRL